MTDIEKLLHKGIVERFILPLNSEGDFELHFHTIKHRTPQNQYQKKEYFIILIIKYKDQIVLDNIVEFERFLSSLRTFIDKGKLFDDKDIFFEGKTKNGKNSLKVNIDSSKYISDSEAKQMHALIMRALSGRSVDLLLRRYMTDKNFYMSPEYSKEKGFDDMNLENTEVIDFMKK